MSLTFTKSTQSLIDAMAKAKELKQRNPTHTVYMAVNRSVDFGMIESRATMHKANKMAREGWDVAILIGGVK
jgi:hypothetical protein